MCVLVVVANPVPGISLLVAANRDEFTERLSAPPGELGPGIFGGKDLAAGGTWLGVNRHSLVVAVTNRRHPPRWKDSASRGMLCLDALRQENVASIEPLAAEHVQHGKSAGFNLVSLRDGHGLCWHYDGTLRRVPLDGSLHVISSHRDMDDPAMPERRVVMNTWTGDGDRDRDHLLERLKEILRDHSDGGSAICKHADGYGTVSSTLIVSTTAKVGSYAGIPRRSRSSRTRTVVQVFPSADLQRIRFIVIANSLSGHCPPSLRMTSTGLG